MLSSCARAIDITLPRQVTDKHLHFRLSNFSADQKHDSRLLRGRLARPHTYPAQPWFSDAT